jgi:electron transfer flavoprotein beta subunit
MGGDRGVFIAQEDGADEYARAAALAEVIKEEAPGLVLAGHMAADDGSSQVPSRIAEILGWPNVNVITSLEIADGKATVTREADGGIETVEVPLPAVLSGQVTWYEAARYPSMKGIMQAKKKKVDNKEAAADNKAVVVSYAAPAAKAPGQKITGEPEEVAAQLADWMLNTVKVEVK